PGASTPIPSAATDEALMRAYAEGHSDALEVLFKRHAPWIASFLRQGLSTDRAQDLLQETFLQLHRSRRDFKEGATLRPLLFTIALNVKRQDLRRERRRRELPVDTFEGSLAAPAPPDIDVTRDIQAALGELPEAQREVIRLHWME